MTDDALPTEGEKMRHHLLGLFKAFALKNHNDGSC